MLIQPYQLAELRFACCFRVYYRWRTHRGVSQPALSALTQETLASLVAEYGIHILEASAGQSDVKVLASFGPSETVAAGAGKMKGRVSKWLREELKLPQKEKLLSRGYFACTTGASTADAVQAYLDKQGEHHGYTSRARPPIFVESYALAPEDEKRLSTDHAVTLLRFHLVLATSRRRGIFGREAAQAVADCWRHVQEQHPMFLEKVSFVPDHVHLAVRTHPTLSPATIVVTLMNASQEAMWKGFADSVIQARVERLWQPSAYIGSFGELESAKIAAYVRKWSSAEP